MVKGTPKDMKQHSCAECKINGVYICTATKSGIIRGMLNCNKGELSMSKAKERKRLVSEKWSNYIKLSSAIRFSR